MDLVYWIDYLNTFGAMHKIPSYDNMRFWYYYNLDILLCVIPVVWAILLCSWKLICCCWSIRWIRKDKVTHEH